MLVLVATSGAALSTRSASPEPETTSWTTCTNPTPEDCSDSGWTPVCGVAQSGVPRVYGNGCLGCNNLDVVGWTKGGCEQYKIYCAPN